MTEPAGVLSFGLLGDLRAERHDRRLDLGPRLQRHLLAILLVEAGHIVAVDRLIDLLKRSPSRRRDHLPAGLCVAAAPHSRARPAGITTAVRDSFATIAGT